MVAPAPVSSLLHAVAVVKAGAFGIVRVVYEVFGLQTAELLGLLEPLAWVAAFTIIYGSVRALFQGELKKRLAYSTVSQVSYIVLGTAMFGPVATIGGVVHLVHQGVMKITLFFTAGNYAEELDIHRIDEMDGVGRRMPLTSIAFSIGALGMIGLPPLAGYVSKTFLQEGAELAGAHWIVWVLNLSGLLNAAYFLPILYRIWIRKPAAPWPSRRSRGEVHWMLLFPPLITAAAVVFFGVFADVSFSPLSWAKIIAAREYVDSL
jgi:multicomponent Na+:H+ antiporter subunit D